jgi:hypothetical protein
MKKLDFVSIEINEEGEPKLQIMIHRDGTINRKGSGTNKPVGPFVIGMGNTAELFAKLNALITPDFESFLNGVYDEPDKKGKVVCLEINLMIDATAAGCKFMYGIDSSGPPQPIRIFVEKSIALTNSWYVQANRKAGIKRKRWWQFWN